MARRKPKPEPVTGDDSAAIHGVIAAMMKAIGRGGLTYMSQKLGTGSPSTLKKRMATPETAFDPVTMRAVLLVAGSKFENSSAEQNLIHRHHIGDYEITIVENPDGTTAALWKTR